MHPPRSLTVLALPWLVTSAAAAPLTPEQADKVRAVVKPQAAEQRWEQIPCKTSL